MTMNAAGGGAREGGHWVRLVREWEGLQAHWYCGERCAEDPVYGLNGARPARAVAGSWPLFCARCGLPVGNPLSAEGRRRAREIAAEVGGWQADALADRYGIKLGGRRRRTPREEVDEGRWAA